MTIFFREIARNRKQFLVWTIILVLSSIGMMAMYPTFADQAGEYNELMKKFPKEMLEALGLDQLNMGLILDYFAYVFLYIILFGGVYAMLLGSSIISKEESEKTVEFLMAKPVTRKMIITSKAACVLFYLVLFNLIFAVADYFMFEAVKKDAYSMNIFLLLHFGFFMLQLTFAAVGLLISVFVVKAKSLYPIVFGVVLGAFFLNIISAMSDKLENFKYLSPFKYVSPADMVKNGKIETTYLVIMAVVVIISVALTYLFYNRKNISV
ncbi:MAG: ABC transporter permease [Clostridia bacterium]|nr:ABC transporter permease [Clostridia bacterium]